MAARISKADYAERVLSSGTPVLVDFYSDSCVACKKLAPALGEIEELYEDRLTVYKVNTNFDTELAEGNDVSSNPTLILYREGEELDRKVGALRPAELTAWIEQYLQ